MLTPPPRLGYVKVPYSFPKPGRFLWFVWGSSVVAGIASLWFFFLISSELASHRQYIGQLSPQNDPVPILLPKGAIVDKVVAAEDDMIEAGQTVATLDIGAMKRSLDRLTEELLHDDTLRDCLVAEKAPDTQFIAQLAGHVQDRILLAVHECEEFLGGKGLIENRLTKTLVALKEEHRLIARYIRLLAENADLDLSAAEKHADARQALALALLRNKLEKQMLELELDAKDKIEALRSKRLVWVRELSRTIKIKNALRESIVGLLDAPRIQAPKNGFIVDVRSIVQSEPLAQDTQFIELRPEDGLGYHAYFDLSHEVLEGIKPGDKVRLKLLGEWKDAPMLMGEVADLTVGQGQNVRADIVLDTNSVVALDDPRNGIALRNSGTASVIHVTKDAYNALDVLRGQLSAGILAPNRGWFITHLADRYLNLTHAAVDL